MKTKYFLTGMLTVLLIAALSVFALASDGWSVTVHPIRVMVDGQVFRPKDAAGNDVSPFTIGGTTYAPLRALAEAYGLEVGYDAENHVATVQTKQDKVVRIPDPTARDFQYQWQVTESAEPGYDGETVYAATYAGTLDWNEFLLWWSSFSSGELQSYAKRLAADVCEENGVSTAIMQFSYGPYSLGAVRSDPIEQKCDFSAATLWNG